MTTLEPGARVVLTQGLVVRPRSTAFFASRAAPTITDGFEVLVQLVIEAMTTAPWSISHTVPSSRTTGVRRVARPPGTLVDGESLAGNDSSPAASTPSSAT